MSVIPTTIAAHIGRTPVVQMTRIAPECDCALFAKLEAFNPGGSVKDRIGVAMIEAAEREGRIEPGRTTIVEATSGNTGIALAFVCAAKGYDLVLTLPQGMSRERERLLALYGARFEITESLGGMNEAVDAARADGDARRRVPARSVLQPGQPGGPPPHDRAGAVGGARRPDRRVRRRRRHRRHDHRRRGVPQGAQPRVHVVGVEPAGSPVLSGGRPGPHRIQGIGAGFVPPVLNRDVIDEVIAVGDDDAVGTAHLMAMREGVLAGISCGAATSGALEVARRPEFAGAADRRDPARLRRALRLAPLVRAATPLGRCPGQRPAR